MEWGAGATSCPDVIAVNRMRPYMVRNPRRCGDELILTVRMLGLAKKSVKGNMRKLGNLADVGRR